MHDTQIVGLHCIVYSSNQLKDLRHTTIVFWILDQQVLLKTTVFRREFSNKKWISDFCISTYSLNWMLRFNLKVIPWNLIKYHSNLLWTTIKNIFCDRMYCRSLYSSLKHYIWHFLSVCLNYLFKWTLILHGPYALKKNSDKRTHFTMWY